LFKLALVLRYLRKRKITVFPIAGVALGVLALVVVLSVMEGFDTDFRVRIRGIMPDMTVDFLDIYGYSGDVEKIVGRLEAMSEIRAASPYVSGLALAVVKIPSEANPLEESVSTEPVEFKGFDFEREAKVLGTNLTTHLKYEGSPFAGRPYGGPDAQAPLIVGARLAGAKFPGVRTKTTDWGRLDRGNVVKLLTFTPQYDRSALNGDVANVISTGLYNIDSHTLFMPLDWARAFRRVSPDSISGISVALTKYNAATVAAAKEKIRKALSEEGAFNFSISTWEESRRTLLTAVAMERRIMAFILFFFLVVAGFSISAILVMIVFEKIRDIGILRAMGASSRGVAWTFLAYGVTIGVIGAGIGLALGVLFVENLDSIESFVYVHTGWQPFPPDIYDLPAIPRILNWWTNCYIVLTAVAVSFAASVLPAVRAAWLDPVEAIRYE